MSWYYDHKPTIRTEEGIKAKSKRGAFVKSWWAERWIKAMEQVMDRGRLQRGRSYARKGQVLSLDIGTGGVLAKVQGSRRTPYKIEIEIAPLAQKEWELVLDALAERPLFVAQLLAGEMPLEIEEAFTAVKLSLFPGKRELQQNCNCPDWAAVCKHLAAAHYILAERFDEDPFLLFQLRGKSQAEILASLGTGALDDTAVIPDYQPAPPLVESLDNFWQIGAELDHFQVHIAPPATAYPVLERLGDPDFMPNVGLWLGKAYDVITETAVATAFETENHDKEQPEP